MIKFLFGKLIAEIVAKEVEKEISGIDENVSRHCREAIGRIFSDKNDIEIVMHEDACWGAYNRHTLVKVISDKIHIKIKEDEESRVKEAVSKLISGEKLIDDIVDRINRKQIK